eukprot:Skav234334  [mRNA]  locus=scaffold306:269950:270587:+ [translate_table: standard]
MCTATAQASVRVRREVNGKRRWTCLCAWLWHKWSRNAAGAGFSLEVPADTVPDDESWRLVSYNAVISACGKATQWRMAINLFAMMREASVLEDHITQTAVITALEKGGQWNLRIKFSKSSRRDS